MAAAAGLAVTSHVCAIFCIGCVGNTARRLGRMPKGQNRTRRDEQDWNSGRGGSSAISNASRIEFCLYEGFCSGQAIFGDDAKNIAGESCGLLIKMVHSGWCWSRTATIFILLWKSE